MLHTRAMRVLVACEFTGAVRRAFRALGHDAYSCDFLPAEDESPHHLQGNVLDQLSDGWDLMIAHPPCTCLSSSGRWYWSHYPDATDAALGLVLDLMNAPISKIAVENPIGIISTCIEKPTQIIQPWQFGHGETKATCLWLKNLPKLQPTNIVSGRHPATWLMSPSPTRGRDRSRTYSGIAHAMAHQWSIESNAHAHSS